MAENRKRMGWEVCEYGDAQLIILSELAKPEAFLENFVLTHRDAIHVCNGFRSLVATYVKKFLLPHSGIKLIAWSERPGVFENRKTQLVKGFCSYILNCYYAFKYKNKTQAYLPIGTLSVDAFARYSWDRNVLFPFMYDSHIPDITQLNFPKKTNTPVKFLYVGQFCWRKGVDLLINSLNDLNGDWHLSFVGKNGEYEDEIKVLVNRNPRVSYLGVWPSSQVVHNIADFDVCLIPSRFDGWGLLTNEAIHAGVGVIVSDTAASYDLVKASGAGIIVSAGNINSLRSAIQKVIDNPSLATSWKEKARIYSPKITSESIGNYLIDVLEYVFFDKNRIRPQCPWL
jgi:glycosyltransferase involved in cell wall biosynthesis